MTNYDADDNDALALFSSDNDDGDAHASASQAVSAAPSIHDSDNDTHEYSTTKYNNRRRSDRPKTRHHQTTNNSNESADKLRSRRTGGMFEGDDSDNEGIEELLAGGGRDHPSGSSVIGHTHATVDVSVAGDAVSGETEEKKKTKRITKINVHEKLDASK